MLSSRAPAMLSRVNHRALSTARLNHQQQQKHDSSTNEQQQQPHPSRSSTWLVVGLTAGAATCYYLAYYPARQRAADLPTLSKKDVEARGLWVYGEGVYDLNEYARRAHPGGEKPIRDLAGRSFEKVWASEGMKFHRKPEILEKLEGMRVGNVDECWEDGDDSPSDRCQDPHDNDSTDSGSGPVCLIPKVNAKDYRLEVSIADGESLRAFTLEELRGFMKHSIVSSVHCKRDDPAKKVVEATWTGTELRDVLRELKVNQDDYELIRLESLDAPSKPGKTLPLSRVFDESDFHVLLAFEKDGKELSPQQGYPVRVVVPQAAAGSTNVKWLHRVVLVKKPNN